MVKLFWVSKDKNDKKEEKVDKLYNEVWQIAIDILETDNEIIILAPIAGIELEDIDLTFDKSVLNIKWIRLKPEIYNSDVQVRNNECFWWNFERNIILPENLDFDSIKASLENNLLIVTISKLQYSWGNIKIDRIEM